MFRLAFLLTCFLTIAAAGPSQAAPQDSPGTIYIDGVPCNLPCQSYLKWSRQQLAGQAAAAAPRAARPSRTARSSAPKTKPRQVAMLPSPRPAGVPSAPAATENAAARIDPAPSLAADPPAAAMPELDAKTKPEPSNPLSANAAGETTTAALPSPDAAGEMVAILLVRPDINSASDLANGIVAVDEAPAEYSVADVRNAMVAAGAAEVQLVENKTAALVRIMDGEVQAAIVSVLPTKAADVWNGGLFRVQGAADQVASTFGNTEAWLAVASRRAD